MAKVTRASEEAPCGGVALPGKFRRDLPALPSQASSLVKHIMRLKAMHPEVHVKFRDVKLNEMDEATLRMLLDDLNEQLGVD
ncbi:MAG: hypothetical protein U0637_00115 [Phycisphaerales bacterium]